MPYADPAARALPFQADLADPVGNTSRAGAEAISEAARSIRARYVQLLYAAGAAGLTDWEAARRLGIKQTTLIPRRHELGDHVAPTRRKRRCPDSGVGNRVHVLAVFARPGDRLVVSIPEAVPCGS